MSVEENIPDTFDRIFATGNWKPIRNCPGRYIFIAGRNRLTAEEIVGHHIETCRFISEKIPDAVVVAKFATGGGLISYVKENETFLHTLNDADGFARKLQHLGIDF